MDLTVAQDLRDTSFRGGDLRGLQGVPPSNLGGNDWRDADLRGANLSGPALRTLKDGRFRRAKYDSTTLWPHGFNLEDTGAELIEMATPGGDVPPKLFAADHDWNAPSEETVKKRFTQYQFAVKYGVNRSKQGNKPIEEPKGNLTTFRFTGMEYGRARKGVVVPENLSDRQLASLDANTLPKQTIYLIRVQCEMIGLHASGSNQKALLDMEMGFWKKEDGTWETTEKQGVLLLN